MTTRNMAEARRLHAALRDFFARHSGASPDFRGLARVLGLCEAAARAVDDAYCRERLRITAEYASEMLSKRDHSRWGRDSTSGRRIPSPADPERARALREPALQPGSAARFARGQGGNPLDDALRHRAELKARLKNRGRGPAG